MRLKFFLQTTIVPYCPIPITLFVILLVIIHFPMILVQSIWIPDLASIWIHLCWSSLHSVKIIRMGCRRRLPLALGTTLAVIIIDASAQPFPYTIDLRSDPRHTGRDHGASARTNITTPAATANDHASA